MARYLTRAECDALMAREYPRVQRSALFNPTERELADALFAIAGPRPCDVAGTPAFGMRRAAL
jgi:hypothetical protein